MEKIRISLEEFQTRIRKLKEKMEEQKIDALFVYGDEYRKENLRYVSNYWPIFERGGLLVGKNTEPVVLCAPEGEEVAKEMSVWTDIRLLPDFLCVTVPDEIEYPLAHYSSFQKLAQELRNKGELKTLGIVGKDAMPVDLFRTIENAFQAKIVDCNEFLFELRREKSQAEVACLREAARMADIGFKAIMQADLIGMTELEAAGIAEAAARKAGAEHIIFQILGSGERTHRIVGRPTDKVIEDGDMIMCALAVQYEGYVATCEMPFAVGNYSEETRKVIDVLVKALKAGVPYLKAGIPMKEFVRAVKNVYKEEGLSEYDVYPPLHGIGCAEAESPYPDENTEAVFKEGMTVNTDISLFGLPGGSNRIEEGFVITKEGAVSLSPFVDTCCREWK
ncbi:MAG: aminopeptidase P family protein [Lachnospiraceae bacterium]|jgi:Xaa-Pro aminopeptidase|nr:aminopeptidase P family protein [Lachnospiraceae bacterium]